MKRPASNAFGFGGKLATVSNPKPQDPAAAGAAASKSKVELHQVVTESGIVERALKLENAEDTQALKDFCASRKAEEGGASANGDASSTSKADATETMASWNLLSSLFQANSKEELVQLLGFSKEEVKRSVEEAVKAFKATTGAPAELPLGFGNPKPGSSDSGDNDDAGSVAREPLVTFADQSSNATDGMSGSSEGEGAAASASAETKQEATPSETEASVSAVSDATTKLGGAESEITEPSLFGDDTPGAGANAQQQAAADFYSTLGASGAGLGGRPASITDRFNLSQNNIERAGSSVAATIGSRPSSVASESLKPTTFRIYPQEESEADRLLTRALVLGDFESAVSLCLSADRFADALLLAFRGGPELLAKTQKAYFERRTTALPYLRLFQSIVSNDLTDVVQNADLGEWQEIFVVLCTFARPEEFSPLVEQLGQRLEYQFAVSKSTSATASASTSSSSNPTANANSKKLTPAAVAQRRSAVLCYLAAGKLERVVGIWNDEITEEEQAIEQSLGATDKVASAAAR